MSEVNVKEIELYVGERVALSWDVSKLVEKMETGAASINCTVLSGSSVSVVSDSLVGVDANCLINCLTDGCSVVETEVTFDDGQKVNLYFRITVSTPDCS